MTKIEDENLTRKGMGRPKGSQNRVAKEAKEAIAAAAEALGGENRLADWAREAPENEKAFWTTVYPKLVGVSLSGSVTTRMIIETGVDRDED